MQISNKEVAVNITHLNTSGLSCKQNQVLVRKIEVKDRTAGGVYIPEITKERDEHAADEGHLIDASPAAFKDIGLPEIAPGSMCIFPRYAGKNVKDNDGARYVLLNDKDILAVRAE